MITARNVTKQFARVRAVDAVSFDLAPGQALALWGSNGAGKTTLVRCLLGVIRFAGDIEIDGRSVRRRGRRTRSAIGYVPQELAFHDDMRLGAAIAFFARLRRVPLGRAAELLERVSLAGHEHKRLRDLSGGMKQRLALAVALLSDPPVIVLDEPTSNLDASGRREVVETLRALRRDGKTVVFASHRPDEVIALADRVLVMEKGRLVADTTPAKLWPGSAGVQTVRLHLRSASEQHAATLLRDAGHAVHLNGRGLCVAVERDRKAAPIHTLLEARVEVRDFEILDDLTSEDHPS